ncbi:MAG: TolC family protein [Myxococcales bacterium]|nr:TolC family protein [Myxococcales bacterium]
MTRLLASLAVLCTLAPHAAHALQPLPAFLESARKHNFDNREAAATVRQRQHQVDQARWDMTPTVNATAAYTRNQYEVKVTLPTGGDPVTRTITPFNQLDAQLTLTQPVVDVSALRSIDAAKLNLASGTARVAATRQQVEQSVATAYFTLLAAEAFIRATEEVHAATRANLAIVEQRAAAGVASDLDRRRAEVEVERSRKSIADAEYNLAIARQRLTSLSGLAPEPGAPGLDVSLADEAPLKSWVDGNDVAAVKAAEAEATASASAVRSASALLYPSLSVSASERFTNATGFLGKYAIASASANLSWRFDLAVLPQLRASRAQSDLARVRAERARQSAYDDIHAAWHQVRAALAKARSARAERDTSKVAVAQARQRYEAGTGLFLEVTQAERDAFSAQISLIQADADLASARILLRLRAGRELGDSVRISPAGDRDPGPPVAPPPATRPPADPPAPAPATIETPPALPR